MRERAEIGDSSPFCRRLAKKINSWPLLRGAVEAIASSVAPRFVFPSRKGQFPNSAAQVSTRSFDLRKRGSQARAARAERREGGPPEQSGSALPERDPQGFQSSADAFGRFPLAVLAREPGLFGLQSCAQRAQPCSLLSRVKSH